MDRAPLAAGRPLAGFAALSAVAVGISVWLVATGSTGLYLLDSVDIQYLVIALAAFVACGVAASRSAGPARTVWVLIAASVGLHVVGDIAFVVVDALGEPPYVSPIDILYTLGYPVMFCALWVLARARNPTAGPSAVIDGLAGVAGLGLLTWQFVIVAPGGLADADGPLAQVVLVSYPLEDLLLLGAITGVLLVGGRRAPALWGVTAFVGLYLVADLAYAVLSYGGDRPLLWSDLGFVLAYVALGVSALSPSAPDIAEAQAAQSPGLWRFVLLAVAAVSPGFTAALTIASGSDVNLTVFLATTVAVATLLCLRMARALTTAHQARTRAEAAHDELDRRANEDALTGLPNRHALLRAITELGADQPLALLFIDLDRFKVVNDTAGHQAGDLVLRQAAARIADAVRGGDLLYRLAGDEFVVLCPGVSRVGDAEEVGTRVVGAMGPAFRVEPMEWFVGASVGIAIHDPGDPIAPEQLVHAGDIAMYEAKRDGQRSMRSFDLTMEHRLRELHDTELSLRHAVEQSRIEAAFQPIVALADGHVVGFETLARWRRSDGSLSTDADFVEVAEQTGLIAEIDHAMLVRACHFIKARNERNLDRAPEWVSVNLAASNLASADLADRIGATIRLVGIDPSWLVVELTEGALSVDPDVAVGRLTRVHDLGVGLAIDDFGTGFSSLAHLLRFPVDVLKVDRLFIEAMGASSHRRSGAAAALQVASTLGLRAVAEGVETRAQADGLRELGYELAQGFYFGRPMSEPEAQRLEAGGTGGDGLECDGLEAGPPKSPDPIAVRRGIIT